MKQLKIFLCISFCLLLIAAFAVGYVWLKVQQTIQSVEREDSLYIAPAVVDGSVAP